MSRIKSVSIELDVIYLDISSSPTQTMTPLPKEKNPSASQQMLGKNKEIRPAVLYLNSLAANEAE